MRLAMRVLALVALAVFGLGLLYDIALYLRNPCPPGFGPLAFYYLPAFAALFGVPLALLGSALAAVLASSRRQWGWLAGLLVASSFSLVFIAALSGSSASFILLPATALTWTFDHVFGLTCGGQSSAFSMALGLSLPLLASPLALLAYSLADASGAPTDSSQGAAERTIIARRLLWVGAVVALALNVLLSYLRLSDVPPFGTEPGLVQVNRGGGPFNTPVGMLAAYIISPVGVILVFVLGAVLATVAFRRRAWGWFAALLTVELLSVLLYAVYYLSQPSVYVPILYRWPALSMIPVVLPIPLPLVSLAYVWWSGRQSGPDRVAPARPTPAV